MNKFNARLKTPWVTRKRDFLTRMGGWWAIFCCLGWLGFSVSAQSSEELYQAEVAISEREPKAQAAALQQALRQVITKLSGQQRFVQPSVFKANASETDLLVQGYVYENRPANEDGLPQSVLVVNFHPQDIEAFMRQAGIPLWGEKRPLVLLWVDVEGQGLISQDEHPQTAEWLTSSAAQRGLPVLLPLLDLTDRLEIKAQNMLTLERDKVLHSGERYRADAVLLAHIHPQDNGWSGQWKAYTQAESLEWKAQGTVLASVLDEGIQTLTDQLAAQAQAQTASTAADSPTEPVQIRIDKVANYQDYAHIYTYLSGLAMVTDLVPLQTQADGQLLLQLQVRGGAKNLAPALQLSRLLTPVAPESPPPTHPETDALHYQYQP